MSADLSLMLAELRATALARIAQLDADAVGLRADRGADVADDEHDPEGATLSGEWSLLAGLREQGERELAEIDSAIARLASGLYGVCADCGRDIPVARLRARPTSLRCVACAERAGL